MENVIGILNCYADEPKSAPSASYFLEFIENAKIINICHGETVKNLDEFDAYIISGSRSCHMDKLDWLKYLESVVKEIHKRNIPCLAVCFGHQLVAKIFGGKTIVESNGEEGFQNILTNYNDVNIELFNGLPNPVKIYQSHHDSVIKSPSKSINTICNEKCVQYFQYGSIHSIQSHPEISVATAIKIAKRDNQNIEEIHNGVNDGNIQSQSVLFNFLSIVKKTQK